LGTDSKMLKRSERLWAFSKLLWTTNGCRCEYLFFREAERLSSQKIIFKHLSLGVLHDQLPVGEACDDSSQDSHQKAGRL
jgi:hypothetical protein